MVSVTEMLSAIKKKSHVIMKCFDAHSRQLNRLHLSEQLFTLAMELRTNI